MKDRIKAVRKESGLNQTEFAKRLWVSLSTVQKWETGVNRVPDNVAQLMAQRFGVDLHWLLTGEGEMHRESSTDELILKLAADVTTGRSSEERRWIAEWLATAEDEDLRRLMEYAEQLMEIKNGHK